MKYNLEYLSFVSKNIERMPHYTSVFIPIHSESSAIKQMYLDEW